MFAPVPDNNFWNGTLHYRIFNLEMAALDKNKASEFMAV
jgi:hypothetical protein